MGTAQSTHTNATEISFASSATRSLEQGAGGNKQNIDSSVSGRKTDENSKTVISNNKNRSVVIFDGVSIENTEVILENEEDSVDSEWYDSDDSLCDTDEYEKDDFFGADDEEEEEDDWNKERLAILEDARNLSLMADFYHNPHKSVVTTDGAGMGRNYFHRPSAPATESLEEAEERAQILADAAALMKIGVDYLLPEIPVVYSDPAACGRNYFDRASAALQEEEDMMDEREDILADMAQLKKHAQDYLQPERPVVVDALATSRNYFDRPSAPTLESLEEAEERAQILADAAALKKLAVDYLHPELPVVTSDSAACGRNYFDRASADGHDDMIVEDLHQWYDPPTEVPTLFSYIMAKEQAQVLADAAALKQLAVDYLHPESPVKSTGGGAMGRNYFLRASAEECEMDMEERDAILQEMAQLEQLAIDYLHPELPVKTTDGCAMGRNYFSRLSAPEQLAPEDAEEGGKIFQEMALMKQVAGDYLCPEKPVVSNGYGARCYFDRASEASHLEHIHSRQDVNNDDNVHGYHDRVLDLVHNGEESYQGHSEHFEMEMDDLETFRDNLRGTPIFSAPQLKGKGKTTNGVSAEEDEEGGNLSRSPSSVMLFELAGC